MKHLGIARTLNDEERGDVAYVRQPIDMSRTPSGIVAHPPAIGEHTDEILGQLGYDKAAIAELRVRQVV